LWGQGIRMICRTSDEKMRKIVAELADKLNSVENTELTTSNLVRQLADKVGDLADKHERRFTWHSWHSSLRAEG